MKKLKLFSLLMLLFVGVTQMKGADYSLTTTITDGDYVIGCINGTAGTDNVVQAINTTVTTGSSGWAKYTSLTPSKGVISNPSSSVVWTLKKLSDNSFSLKNGDNYYKIKTSTGGGSVILDENEATIYFIAVGNSTNAFILSSASDVTLSAGNKLGCNQQSSNGYRLYAHRNHGTGNTDIATYVRFYKKDTRSTVSFSAPSGGTLVIKDGDDAISTGAKFDANKTLTVTAAPDGTHKNASIKVIKTGVTPEADVTATVLSGSTLTVPAYDITVSASFEDKAVSVVSVEDPDHGTITVTGAANLSSVMEGTVLTVNVAGTGYTFTSMAYKTGDESTVVPISEGQLTMPAYAITITADEEKINTPFLETSVNAINFGSVKKNAAVEDIEFTVNGDNLNTENDLAIALLYGTDFEVSPASIDLTSAKLNATTITVSPKSTATPGTYEDILVISGGGLADDIELDVSITVLPTYTVSWYVNGDVSSYQTDVAGTALEIPSNPTPTGNCSDKVFIGWGKKNVAGKQDLINTEGLTMFSKDTAFYAVFATEVSPAVPAGYRLSNDAPVLDDDFVIIATKSSSKYYAVGTDKSGHEITISNGVISSTTNMIWYLEEATTGLYYNDGDDNYIHLNKSSYNVTTSTTNGDLSCVSNGDGSYKLKVNSSNVRYLTYNGTSYGVTDAAASATPIYIFKYSAGASAVYNDTLTICPSCETVTLAKAGEGGGNTFELRHYSKVVSSVKTCNAVEINVVATTATGYELSNVALSGVAGATYSAGVISIPADATGTLTVTATFSKINYTVTLAQTGGAGAALSNQENKHYGDEITISAPAVDGYVFISWSSEDVELANAKSASTTFDMPNDNVTVTAKYSKVLTVAEAKAIIDDNTASHTDICVMGYVETAATSISSGKLTYWIADLDANGFMTETTMQVYLGKGVDNASFSSINDLAYGDQVYVFGDVSKYDSKYQFNTGNYLLSYDEGTYDGIEIYGTATTTAYEVGDAFATTGLGAKEKWTNGYAQTIASPDWEIAPATIAANTESVSVTASYERSSTTYTDTKVINITVNTHEVIFDDPENGSLTVKISGGLISSGDHGYKGETITIEATPDSNYALASLNAVTTSGTTDIKESKSFTIGTEDVEIVAVFSKTTALEDVEDSVKAVKVLRNGVLYIEKSGRIYNAQGQLVK